MNRSRSQKRAVSKSTTHSKRVSAANRSPTSTSAFIMSSSPIRTTTASISTSTTIRSSRQVVQHNPTSSRAINARKTISANVSTTQSPSNIFSISSRGMSDDYIKVTPPRPPTPERAPITRPIPVDRQSQPDANSLENQPMHPRANVYRQRVTELAVTGKGRELEAYLASEPVALTEAGINNPDHVGSTLLCTAAKKHFFSTAIALLKNGADPNLCSKTGPPLFHSISTMDLAITKLLLRHGANPDYQNSKGQSALMIASTLPSVAFALQLIEAGCNKDAVDNDGRTALMYASRSGTPQMVEVLRDRGADVNIRDNSNKSAAEYSQDRADGRGEDIISILRTPPRPRPPRRGFNYGHFQDQNTGEVQLEF